MPTHQNTVSLAESPIFYRQIVESSEDAIIGKTLDAIITSWNKGAEELYGYSASETIGKNISLLIPRGNPDELPGIMHKLKNGQRIEHYQTVRVHKNGNLIDVSVTISPIKDDQGNIIGASSIARDITHLQQAERALKQSEERYRMLLENVRDYAIFTLDLEGHVLDWNEGAERVFGYTEEDIIGKPYRTFFSAEEVQRGEPEKELNTAAKEGRAEDERWHSRKDESRFYASGVTTAIKDEAGNLIGFAKVARDMTDKREMDERMRYQAFHDALTDLPNRLLLNDRLEVALQHAKRKHEQVSVMFLDLDRFKDINDTLGHQVGDMLLQEVARRLRACLRSEDTVARFGGDEFLIMLTDINEATEVERVAKSIFRCLKPVFKLDSKEIHLNTSIGIATYPQDGDTFDTLLKNADNALYQAKEAGRNMFKTYTKAMHLKSSQRLSLENELRKAVDKNQFLVHYQPIVNVKTGKTNRLEALVRWQHPKMGVLQPVDFIELAEETGMILPIGEWVLKEVCRQIKRWELEGTACPPVALNLSARQFTQPDFHTKLCSIVEKAHVAANLIQLEVTETIAMENITTSISKLKMLQDMGYQIAVDDFGTGHSSLSYLKRLPVNRLKIDKSFIRNCLTDNRDAAIVKAIISLGHTLGLVVCAEGVENKAQLSFLKKNKCDTVQGFLLSQPIPPQEVAAWLKN